ncbi:hypothetical protein SHXM_00089 [Streptomyces hygroscopicus]|nr:hypothetical protein SHXM_00089 [Streptomyces hygroscopicus]
MVARAGGRVECLPGPRRGRRPAPGWNGGLVRRGALDPKTRDRACAFDQEVPLDEAVEVVSTVRIPVGPNNDRRLGCYR